MLTGPFLGVDTAVPDNERVLRTIAKGFRLNIEFQVLNVKGLRRCWSDCEKEKDSCSGAASSNPILLD